MQPSVPLSRSTALFSKAQVFPNEIGRAINSLENFYAADLCIAAVSQTDPPARFNRIPPPTKGLRVHHSPGDMLHER